MNALIVDDQPSTLLLMHAILDSAGYKVVECATGEVAIEALARDQYDLMILDLNLPDMSGLDLLRSPRLKPAHMPPVVGITASLTPELVEKAESAGFCRVLQKPISSEQLIETAAAAIRQGRSAARVMGSGPTIDPSILAEIRGISDDQLIHRFVNQALADAWRCLGDLETAVANGDIEAWRQHAQTLNGVVRTLGARRLASAITETLMMPARQLVGIANVFTRRFVDLLEEAQDSFGVWLSHAENSLIGSSTAENRAAVHELSEREREVLHWTAAGKTSSEIGLILGISTRTVNFHITSTLLKLNAVNKTQAVVKAVLLDLLN